MVFASDLRLGNWVFEKGVDDNLVVTIVESIIEEGINHSSFRDGCNFTEYDKLFPIPIAEEYLLKLGFAKEGPYSFTFKKFRVWQDSTNDDWYFVSEQMTRSVYIRMKHLHRLQNVYYAFTEEDFIPIAVKEEVKSTVGMRNMQISFRPK